MQRCWVAPAAGLEGLPSNSTLGEDRSAGTGHSTALLRCLRLMCFSCKAALRPPACKSTTERTHEAASLVSISIPPIVNIFWVWPFLGAPSLSIWLGK